MKPSASRSAVAAGWIGGPEDVSAVLGAPWVVPTDLPEVLRSLVGELPGVVELRLLDRPERPKVFVVVDTHDLERDYKIAVRLCQFPDIRLGQTLDYDVVPQPRQALIPAAAKPI